MLRKALSISAASAALACMLSTATGQELTPLELEGPIQNYQGGPIKVLTVMDMDVIVDGTTEAISPSADRRSANPDTGRALGWGKWFKGDKLPGRKERGFVGGTAIVTGVWDPTAGPEGAGAVVASEVFTEPAENVVLGLVTSNVCTTPGCDDPTTDFVRGNNGPAMLAIADSRIPAGPVGDDGGFELDLTGADLVGVPFAVEGYYGNLAVSVPDSESNEKAIHYFALNLGGFFGDLLANKDAEVSLLRAQCRVGDNMDIRGAVHSAVNEDGSPVDPTGGVDGTIEVEFFLPNGARIVRTTNEVTPAAEIGISAFGEYRIRFDTPFCPETINVSWKDFAGAPDRRAGADDQPVDIRDDTAE